MSDKKKEKRFWESRFNISNPDSAPESITQFGFPSCDYGDDDIEFLTRKVKHIDILMLRESNVTNTGLSYLQRLHYLRELDIKNTLVDDTALPYLLAVGSLEYLHIKFTEISVDGIRQLAAMKNIKKLVCCWPKIREDEGEQLIEQYPDKELILDYK